MVAIKILTKIIIGFYNGCGNLDRMIRLYIKEECRKYIKKFTGDFMKSVGHDAGSVRRATTNAVVVNVAENDR